MPSPMAGKKIGLPFATCIYACIITMLLLSAGCAVAPVRNSVTGESSPAFGSTDDGACTSFSQPVVSGSVKSQYLTEISGIAVDPDDSDRIWAHNDSGDGPVVYALDRQGNLITRITLEGVEALDWEDMDIGPCPSGQCIYIGDIGDNRRQRSIYTVYRIPIPIIDEDDPPKTLEYENFDTFNFTYPNGPENAEGIAVHPDGAIYLFTKDKKGYTDIYSLPEPISGKTVTAVKVARLELAKAVWEQATAADIHPNGHRLLIRTYSTVWEWRLPLGKPFSNIDEAPKYRLPAVIEKQGEAISYDPSTGGYFQISEGEHPKIYFIGCREQ